MHLHKSFGPLSLLLAGSAAVTATAHAEDWRGWGPNYQNTRYQSDESAIGPDNVSTLQYKWDTQLSDQLSATPVVEGNAIYIVDWDGNLNRLDRETGDIVWSTPVEQYTGVTGDTARVSPAIHGNLLIFGDQGGRKGAGAYMIAVNKNTGEHVWHTQVETHPAAVITQSASIHGNTVFVGVSSIEEFYTVSVPGYQCCSFRGSMLALDANTGAIKWRTPTLDDAAYAKGYRGNAIWGSQPTIDPKRKTVYVATGNNYDVPASVGDCVNNVVNTDPTNEAAVRACLEGDENYFDSIVAYDMKDGHVKWWNAVLPFDAFTIACVLLPEVFGDNCPSPSGPDHDFGQAPMLFSPTCDPSRQLLGTGQKSGVFWALDPDTGEVVWNTQVGPGGHVGGAMWGSATDGDRIFVTEANYDQQPWELQGDGSAAGTTIHHGYWSALDPCTGEILWQTPDPNVFPPEYGIGAGGMVMAPVTVANGVVYGGSMAPLPDSPNMFALDAATGDILWDFASGGSVIGGAAVSDGQVFWGSGYTGGALNLGSPNGKLYSFELAP